MPTSNRAIIEAPAEAVSSLPTEVLTHSHRGGEGEPLVLLHGILGTWHIWRPVLTALEAEHDVWAPTLPGHLGGPDLESLDEVSLASIADVLEVAMDRAGIETAHLVGNSLGGWLALELGRRGRARSVVALSPAGGWASAKELRRVVRQLTVSRELLTRTSERGIFDLFRRPRFRRLALANMMERGDRIPAGDAQLMLRGTLECAAFPGFARWVATSAPIASAGAQPYPIRIAWAEHDKVIPYEHYGVPLIRAIDGAEVRHLPGVGHVPMYDDPELIVQTILEVTRPTASPPPTPNPTETQEPAMTDQTFDINGMRGRVTVRRWDPAGEPRRIVVLAHGLGEHSGRYGHVAERLVADGAAVYAPDHWGHGRSDGEPGLVSSIEPIVDDLYRVIDLARAELPGLPLVLVGHSLGGMIATRAIQRGERPLDAAVLSGPAIGGNPAFEGLLAMDPLPDVPLDPEMLSRDPEVGRAYAEDPLVYHGPLRRETLEAIFDTVEVIRTGPSFGALPVLWLQGSEDGLAPLAANEVILEQLRGERFERHVYPGARHEVFNEINRDEVIDTAARFIAEVEARSVV